MAPASGYGSFPGQTYTPPGSGPIPSFNGGGRGGGHMGGYEQQQNHYQPGPAARKQCQFNRFAEPPLFWAAPDVRGALADFGSRLKRARLLSLKFFYSTLKIFIIKKMVIP